MSVLVFSFIGTFLFLLFDWCVICTFFCVSILICLLFGSFSACLSWFLFHSYFSVSLIWFLYYLYLFSLSSFSSYSDLSLRLCSDFSVVRIFLRFHVSFIHTFSLFWFLVYSLSLWLCSESILFKSFFVSFSISLLFSPFFPSLLGLSFIITFLCLSRFLSFTPFFSFLLGFSFIISFFCVCLDYSTFIHFSVSMSLEGCLLVSLPVIVTLSLSGVRHCVTYWEEKKGGI